MLFALECFAGLLYGLICCYIVDIQVIVCSKKTLKNLSCLFLNLHNSIILSNFAHGKKKG